MEAVINFTCHLFLLCFSIWLVGGCISMIIATIAVWLKEKKSHIAYLSITLFLLFLLPFSAKFLLFCVQLLIG